MTNRASTPRLRSTVPSAALALAFAVSLALTVFSWRERAAGETRFELARLGLEDVSRRIEQSARNLASIRAMNRAGALARARSLAQFVADNPAVLRPENRARFDAYAALLGVDELHVSDSRGILVRSVPRAYEGCDMSASAQSAAFLPAITNAAFALVQEPQGKGLATGDRALDATAFQYAGVARLDAPGIVQVGYSVARLQEAEKLADVETIARTTHIGRQGTVRIVPLAGGASETNAVSAVRTSGSATVIETLCGGYRVTASVPLDHPRLAAKGTLDALLVLDLVLLLLLVTAFPAVREHLRANIGEIREILRAGATGRRLAFLRMFTTPIALTTFLFFAIILFGLHVFCARQARRAAEVRLAAAADDIVDELDGCVGRQLAFVGKTICERYGSPEQMTNVDMKAVMDAYGLDELNAIDGRGVIVASNLPIVGDDQWTKVNPRKFNQALLAENRGIFAQCFRPSADEPDTWYKYVGVAFPPPAKGYLQLGFCRARMRSSFDYTLQEIVNHWHVGESGFYVVSKTENGEILSTFDNLYTGRMLAGCGFDVFRALSSNNIERRDPVSQEFFGFARVNYFESDFNGVPCLCTTGVVNQFHRYIVAIPLSEVYGSSRRTVLVTAVLLFLALLVVNLFLTRLSRLVARLKDFIAADRERREKDLALAKTIQLSALPLVFPNGSDYSIFARMDTAREVGGDFYDFYTLPSGRILFLVADVSGKGIPAALFMMRAKATVRAAVFGHEADLAKAVAEANDALAEKNDAEMFVTAWIGVLDRATGEVEYVNAGHNPPLVKRADGSVAWMRGRSGLVLAAQDGIRYRTQRLTLAAGDSLVLYTDGVTEAMNAANAQYGEPRLERTLAAAAHGSLVEAVRADVTAFVAGAEPSDDVTILALDYKGAADGRPQA